MALSIAAAASVDMHHAVVLLSFGDVCAGHSRIFPALAVHVSPRDEAEAVLAGNPSAQEPADLKAGRCA